MIGDTAVRIVNPDVKHMPTQCMNKIMQIRKFNPDLILWIEDEDLKAHETKLLKEDQQRTKYFAQATAVDLYGVYNIHKRFPDSLLRDKDYDYVVVYESLVKTVIDGQDVEWVATCSVYTDNDGLAVDYSIWKEKKPWDSFFWHLISESG